METTRSAAILKREAMQRTRVIMKKLENAVSKPLENIKIYVDPADINIWYGLLHNFSGQKEEYVGGQYLARLVLTPRFPYDPPEFFMMTPNGVYACESDVCIHIGKYHKENYTAAMALEEFFNNLINGMICHDMIGEGLGIMHTTQKEKKRYAAESTIYNAANYQQLLDKINAADAENVVRWNANKAKLASEST